MLLPKSWNICLRKTTASSGNSFRGTDKKNVIPCINNKLQKVTDKKFELADIIRNQFNVIGIKLQDTSQGTTWKISK